MPEEAEALREFETDEEAAAEPPVEADQEDRKWNRVPASYRRAVGARLRQFREAAGYSIAELAAITGRKEQTIASWETGRSLPKYPELVEHARVLRADLWVLLTGDRPQRWEAIVALLPIAYRKAVLAVRDRKEIRQLVEALADMDPKDVALIWDLVRRLRAAGSKG